MLMLTGCGKFGNKFANEEPTIAITSYEGFDDSALLAPYAETELYSSRKSSGTQPIVTASSLALPIA